MHHIEIPFSDIPHFSFKDKFYQTETEKLRDFISYLPQIQDIQKAINDRKNYPVDRTLLRDYLKSQYSGIVTSDIQKMNIEKIADENTFTVTTAHQPCLFGGPAYYFYKIFSTIHLAELLNKTYSEQYFVPVFVNGGEDHDFEEVNHMHLFGKTIRWQTGQTGSVGRFQLEGLDLALRELKEIVGGHISGVEFVDMLEEAYKNSLDYNEFVFRWVNAVFSKWGLLVLSMDSKALKEAFRPYMEKEIFHMPSQSLVEETQEKLNVLGFKSQAHAREINLFYLRDNIRERIVFEGDHYLINNTDYRFTLEEMKQELVNFPERFSPNVVTRPLFQEVILPDVAFVCGGGEVAYWIERKSQFEHFGVFYPMIIRRNSVMVIQQKLAENIEKAGLHVSDFTGMESQIIQKYLDIHASQDIHLDKYRQQIQIIFDEIQNLSIQVDKTLEGYVGKEGHNIIKIIDSVESRLIKAVKNKESIQLNKISNIYSKLHPDGRLQERFEHFLQFQMGAPSDLTEYLMTQLNPFRKELLLIVT
jgi:bacillithiol biosynthesis cysteine-adding enzyme BshC